MFVPYSSCKGPGNVKVCGLLKEINTFIDQGHIKLIKSDNKDIYNVTIDFCFKINAVLLNCLFICEKILGSTTIFNIANNQKCLLSSKSVY